jgi:hypothetical protein
VFHFLLGDKVDQGFGFKHVKFDCPATIRLKILLLLRGKILSTSIKMLAQKYFASCPFN